MIIKEKKNNPIYEIKLILIMTGFKLNLKIPLR